MMKERKLSPIILFVVGVLFTISIGYLLFFGSNPLFPIFRKESNEEIAKTLPLYPGSEIALESEVWSLPNVYLTNDSFEEVKKYFSNRYHYYEVNETEESYNLTHPEAIEISNSKTPNQVEKWIEDNKGIDGVFVYTINIYNVNENRKYLEWIAPTVEFSDDTVAILVFYHR
jgi:hypothetical protein